MLSEFTPLVQAFAEAPYFLQSLLRTMSGEFQDKACKIVLQTYLGFDKGKHLPKILSSAITIECEEPRESILRVDRAPVKLIRNFCYTYGEKYLQRILKSSINKMGKITEKSEKKTLKFAEKILEELFTTPMPEQIQWLFGLINKQVQSALLTNELYTIMGSIFFLRFFVPAIINPVALNIVTEIPASDQLLISVGKLFMMLANNIECENKEYRHFIEKNFPKVCAFYQSFPSLNDEAINWELEGNEESFSERSFYQLVSANFDKIKENMGLQHLTSRKKKLEEIQEILESLTPNLKKRPIMYTSSDIELWLQQIGLEEYAPSFRKNQVDGKTLLDLSVDDITHLGVQKLGHKKKLERELSLLKLSS